MKYFKPETKPENGWGDEALYRTHRVTNVTKAIFLLSQCVLPYPDTSGRFRLEYLVLRGMLIDPAPSMGQIIDRGLSELSVVSDFTTAFPSACFYAEALRIDQNQYGHERLTDLSRLIGWASTLSSDTNPNPSVAGIRDDLTMRFHKTPLRSGLI